MSYVAVVKDDTLTFKFVQVPGIHVGVFKPMDLSVTINDLLYESHVSFGDGYHNEMARNLLTHMIHERKIVGGDFTPEIREKIRKRLLTHDLTLPYQDFKQYRCGEKVGIVEVCDVKEAQVRVKALETFSLSCGKIIRKNSNSGYFPAHLLPKMGDINSRFWVEKCANVARSNLNNCYIRGVEVFHCDIDNSEIRGKAIGDHTLRGIASKTIIERSNILNSTIVFNQSDVSGIYRSELDAVGIEKCRGSFDIRNSTIRSTFFSRTPTTNIADSTIRISRFSVPKGAKGELFISLSYLSNVSGDTCSVIDDSSLYSVDVVKSTLVGVNLSSPTRRTIKVESSDLHRVSYATLCNAIETLEYEIKNLTFRG